MTALGSRLSALGAIAVIVVIGVACAREGSAQGSGGGAREPVVVDDTASLARLLVAVRGADPLLCELATRHVDNHGWWSRWGPLTSNPLDRDSASAAIIAWVQRDHNDPAVVPRLRAAMRDPDGCVRRVAGSFLGRVEHPNATAALVDALGDANVDTRHVAAIGLGLADTDNARSVESATQPLIRALRDESATVRRAAAWALGSLEVKGAQDALIQALERDADGRVRQAAAWAIGRLHD